MKPKALLIENCDFDNYPTGGQLSFAKYLLKIFGNKFALVGISTDNTLTGQWIEKKLNGINYYYFSIGRRNPDQKKPVIPERLTGLVQLKKYKNKIRSLGVDNVFIRAPELLIAVSSWGFNNICYMFPGVENPLKKPRYFWGRPLAPLFDYMLFSALQKTSRILACADQNAINRMLTRSSGRLKDKKIIQFPTRVDTDIFKPQSKTKARAALNMDNNDYIIIALGRINEVKGYKLILKSFSLFHQRYPYARLIYAGDGEDKPVLLQLIKQKKLENQVIITGFEPPDKIALYLNAADLMVVGSHNEGWSNAMLEALACGKPIVSTKVSGANELIIEGENGFVLSSRDPQVFALAMENAMKLMNYRQISCKIAEKYALTNLKSDLTAVWPALL